SRFQGNKPFILRHSMLTARVDRDGALRILEGWMGGGVMKPDDLRKASRVTSLECTYLPFYVFEVDATTNYVGVLTRTGTNERRTGDLRRDFFWKILARRRSPVRRSFRSEEHTSELQSRGHLVCRL